MMDEAALVDERRQATRDRLQRQSGYIVAGLAAAAAAGAAMAGVHPTGLGALDRLYAAALGAGVTMAASRSSRGARLLFAAVVVGACRLGEGPSSHLGVVRRGPPGRVPPGPRRRVSPHP